MAKHKFRVWVAGPRAWENEKPLARVVDLLIANHGIGGLLVMTGGAPGVDTLTENVCVKRGVHVFACRACWPIGRHAGPIRNRVIAVEFDPDLFIALHYFRLDPTNHRGTQSAIEQARLAHIPTKVIRVKPETALPSSIDNSSPMGNRARAERGLPPKVKKPRRKRPST